LTCAASFAIGYEAASFTNSRALERVKPSSTRLSSRFASKVGDDLRVRRRRRPPELRVIRSASAPPILACSHSRRCRRGGVPGAAAFGNPRRCAAGSSSSESPIVFDLAHECVGDKGATARGLQSLLDCVPEAMLAPKIALSRLRKAEKEQSPLEI
jgi:hypothetical protein